MRHVNVVICQSFPSGHSVSWTTQYLCGGDVRNMRSFATREAAEKFVNYLTTG